MDDKFILMNMDDDSSKKVAEVLGNKTCKKILNYLADNSDKSEEDISKDLKIPLNTVEYNLQKLLKTGLIKKSNDFFWSKKGKKIALYRPAKKHIIISPKNSKINFKSLNSILPLVFVATLVLAISLLVIFNPSFNNSNSLDKEDYKFQTFNSMADMKDYIKDHQINNRGDFFADGGPLMAFSQNKGGMALESSAIGSSASDVSTTNIQVEGVDEADIIKNDDKYIYAVSGNQISIIDAYPAENMEILSKIENIGGSVFEILINGDKLIVFSNDYSYVYGLEENYPDCLGCVLPPSYQEQKSLIYIYDISDKEYPELEDEISMTGSYFDSRMIGNYVYVISNQYVGSDIVLPAITKNGETEFIEPTEIQYQDVEDYSFQYTLILAIDIRDASTSEEVILTGSTQNMYVSEKNIYTVFTQYPGWGRGVMDDVGITEETEKTLINKISIDQMDIEFIASGEVKGHIVNQFSMDEFNNNLRIATTLGDMWDEENPSVNNVYVLNEDLEVIGELEGLAPGEKIYSVRFMGERGYVVTFKKVDPLFVIDLSDPENPDVLGKLKIPGYSDYLHSYDETHIIGIGKDAVDASEEEANGRNLDFAWYQGVKIAIFDVSDVENPIELHKVVIGDRGTDSEVLQDHKAFLFDREKELMVLPITLAEIQGEPSLDPSQASQSNSYGEFTFQGAYVYNINLEDGFELKGRITHYDDDEIEKKSGYYPYMGNRNIRRSLFMDDFLYTFSNDILKANDLDDLSEISFVELLQ